MAWVERPLGEGSRNDPGRDLAGLDRKPTLESEDLKNVVDQEKVAERQERAGMRIVAGAARRALGEKALKGDYNTIRDHV